MDPNAIAALRRGAACSALVLASLLSLVPHTSHAQIVQLWSHNAPRGDASGAVAVGDTLMFVNNNEDQILRLYSRYPSTACRSAIYSVNVQSSLAFTGGDNTADLESAAALTDTTGTTIFWLGSMSNSASGNLRPNRSRVFATRVNGNGSGTPPYTLTYLGRYDKLRDDIIAWDVNNLHGFGTNYFGLAASAAAGVAPKNMFGFNAEGLAFSDDGTTAYIGFRAPLVNPAGHTTGSLPRTHALVIPVLNMPDLVKANPVAGPGAAIFGAPILLPLGVRGIRSIDRTATGEFLITAGPVDTVTVPPSAPFDFRVFLWSGHPLMTPTEFTTTFAATESPEACIPPPGPLTAGSVAQFINDDGSASCWRSMTCSIGTNVTAAGVPRSRRSGGIVRFVRPPGPSPARHRVDFAVGLAETGWADVSILDVAGRRVATVWSGVLERGEHDFAWNGDADRPVRAGPGIYWVTIRTADAVESRSFAWRP